MEQGITLHEGLTHNMGVANIYSDLISYTCTSKYTYNMSMILKNLIIKIYIM